MSLDELELIIFSKSTGSGKSGNSLNDFSTLWDSAFFHSLAHIWSDLYEHFIWDVSVDKKVAIKVWNSSGLWIQTGFTFFAFWMLWFVSLITSWVTSRTNRLLYWAYVVTFHFRSSFQAQQHCSLHMLMHCWLSTKTDVRETDRRNSHQKLTWETCIKFYAVCTCVKVSKQRCPLTRTTCDSSSPCPTWQPIQFIDFNTDVLPILICISLH